MPDWTLQQIKPVVIVSILALLFVLEGVIPMFVGRQRRLRHDLANIALGLVNAGVVALIFAAALAGVAAWAQREGFGLLHLFDAPGWLKWVLAILVFDLWMYLWHRANHLAPLLWRFHQVHHADAQMDASSAMRFHTGEIALSSLARLAVIPLLGISAEQLLVYEMMLQPVILLHHSNLNLPEPLDKLLRIVIVTPRIHVVHHSTIRAEHDSNYSSVFSWWDRLFGTLRWKAPADLRIGLEYTGEAESRNLLRMFTTPFDPVNTKSADDAPHGRDDV